MFLLEAHHDICSINRQKCTFFFLESPFSLQEVWTFSPLKKKIESSLKVQPDKKKHGLEAHKKNDCKAGMAFLPFGVKIGLI